ncbi:MAG: FAD:protein FMN transferase [Planctomycetota bacterium]|jgi:thiamine biosynthesis lipoprotein
MPDPLQLKHIKTAAAALAVLAGLLVNYSLVGDTRIQKTYTPVLGTTMNIAVIDDGNIPIAAEIIIKKALSKVNELEDRLSIYRKDSEISRINSLPAGKKNHLNKLTYKIILESLRYNLLSDGAFDITVKPLMDLYKFSAKKERMPDKEEISRALKLVGRNSLIIEVENRSLSKKNKGTSLNLGAIAKGYAVDLAMNELIKSGVKNGFVEIGGEIRVIGKNENGNNWKVGIQNPSIKKGQKKLLNESLSINSGAIATSGNYRQFFLYNGKHYSHIIDPRTGYPVSNRISGVTITAPTCLQADALATTVSVLGEKDYEEFLDLFTGITAVIQLKKSDGTVEIIRYPTNTAN